MRIRPLTAQEENRVDALCHGRAHNQDHAHYPEERLRQLLTPAPETPSPLKSLWQQLKSFLPFYAHSNNS